jgi:pyrophosphatase PpaX
MHASVPLRGVIFDLDGTLADTLPVCYAAFHAVFARFVPERVFTEAQIASYFGPTEEGVIHQVVPQEHWAAASAAYLQEYAAAHAKCPKPFPGIVAILGTLREHAVPIAVVTGKGLGSAGISLQLLGLAERFDLVETGSHLGAIKSQAIRKVLDIWAIPDAAMGSVAYLGDAPSDITAAQVVGVTPLAAAWAPHTDAEAMEAMRPAATFRSVAEFSQWVHDQVGVSGTEAPDSSQAAG